MVAAVRRGQSLRAVARQFHVALATVQYWVRHAAGHRLDRVDFADQSPGPTISPRRTSNTLENLILDLRRQLREDSPLGEFGAEAIHRELQARGIANPPVPRTIHRILQRRGLLDARPRLRRPPPPSGWYLPEVAARRAELDSIDMIEGLALEGGIEVQVLTAISLHGGLAGAWPMPSVTAKTAVETLDRHWRKVGLPGYAQFDNDTRFQGPRMYPDSLGRVIRLCLALGVVPVFVPPLELGFQAAIESFNGRWQAKVWSRFRHASPEALADCSTRYVTASRKRAASRIEAAPARLPWPSDWRLSWQTPLKGQVVFVRRCDAGGGVSVLGHHFAVDARWPHRLVRAEVDLEADRIRFYALRRREPDVQPLLREVSHRVPRKRFRE